MLYEKKMLILSGEGKGVVMVEKSGRGVRFSLKTFDMPFCDELKAGVITRRTVNVRDLPKGDNPASVFILDVDDISELHFAVFDKRLRLYGAIGKKMWEANVMDLLCRNDRKSPFDNNVRLGALPPISTPPSVLPMPDGTGAPQARLSIYGDEALAENDFYTRLDMSERMPVVDKFLDTPRVLNSDAQSIPDAVAPRIIPRSQSEPNAETTATNAVEVSTDALDDVPQSASAQTEPEQSEQTAHDDVFAEQADEASEKSAAATTYSDAQGVTPPVVFAPTEQAQPPEQSDKVSTAEQPTAPAAASSQTSAPTVDEAKRSAPTEQPAPTAAGQADVKPCADETVYPFGEDGVEQPWECCARYLKARSHRTLETPRHAVKPSSTPAEKVKFLRETAFIERARADIDTIFKHGEKDEKLSALLPEIEWVTVHADGFDVSVGRGGNEFLCYAVTGSYSPTSPLGSEAQWLPRDKAIPTGAGYWLIFQSTATGEIIE